MSTPLTAEPLPAPHTLPGWIRQALIAIAVFVACWGGAIVWWRVSARVPGTREWMSLLFGLPLTVLLAGVIGRHWLAKRAAAPADAISATPAHSSSAAEHPAQAQRVNRILARQQIAEHDPRVWVDYTGVGRAVFDIFKQERVPRIVPVTITFGGEDGPNGHGGHNVTKLGLVSRLQALMHTGKLHMPDTLPLSKLFRRELLDFRVSYTAVGNATFGAREGAHDDLILAVALAVYGLDGGRVATVHPLSEWGF